MTLNLAGEWALSDTDGGNTCAINLPCDGISALYDAGLIPDPYWGRNEYDLRWICERDWIVTREFALDDVNVDLVLSRVDTVVTVKVNDVVVLTADNAFRDYRVSLAKSAHTGLNTISITFHSPVTTGKALADAHDFELPISQNCPIPYGNFLRKPACDFGWDWNIALAPFGVYGDMKIEPTAAPRIDAVMIAQDHDDEGVTLALTAHLTNYAGVVAFEIAGQSASAKAAHGRCTCSVRVVSPEPWWPAGQGDQRLYDLKVSAGTAIATRRIGLRKVELVTEKDAAGLSFKFRVNGRDIYCKGANWIPADALAGRISDAKTRALLQSAVDANMNMVRIWGGGRYEPTSFYDACDELGLLVWQDFMFACNLYPSDRAYVANVKEEIRDNVARIHHHACLAVWCGDNELIGALVWYDCSRKDRDRYLVNYDRLNRAIEDTLLETDPNAIWWPSSPSPGPLNFGDAWHDDGSGDMHFWSVWHEGRDFDHYRDVSPRFCSEFGFQSYPSLRSINQFADPTDLNIASPVLESHQKNTGGNARIAETMFRYFRWPERFDDFVYLSQVQQGIAIATAVTHWRSLKPHNMGALIWQLNDTWPVCSWASLNHDGEWKLLHHMAQNFFAPVLVTAVPDADRITLRAVNDLPDDVTMSITTSAIAMDGTTRPLAHTDITVGAIAKDVLALAADALAPQEMLIYRWIGPNGIAGSDVFAPHPYKHYDLLPSGLKITTDDDGDNAITSQNLALFVSLESDVPGRFDSNAFTVIPGTPRKLHFAPDDPGASPKFTIRDLHSASYQKEPAHA